MEERGDESWLWLFVLAVVVILGPPSNQLSTIPRLSLPLFVLYAYRWKRNFKRKREEAEFKATKNVSAILYNKPFNPEKSRHPLTCVDNFVLHSELRSTQRMKYDSEKRQKYSLLEEKNLQRRPLKEISEAKEVVEFRKTLVHRTKPTAH